MRGRPGADCPDCIGSARADCHSCSGCAGVDFPSCPSRARADCCLCCPSRAWGKTTTRTTTTTTTTLAAPATATPQAEALRRAGGAAAAAEEAQPPEAPSSRREEQGGRKDEPGAGWSAQCGHKIHKTAPKDSHGSPKTAPRTVPLQSHDDDSPTIVPGDVRGTMGGLGARTKPR